MTLEEAIRVLQAIKEHPSMGVYLPDEYEALDLAIKGLEFINENFPESFKDYLNGDQYRE